MWYKKVLFTPQLRVSLHIDLRQIPVIRKSDVLLFVPLTCDSACTMLAVELFENPSTL